jgi:hypothetical protein
MWGAEKEQATATAKADPCGMTNKGRTTNNEQLQLQLQKQLQKQIPTG